MPVPPEILAVKRPVNSVVAVYGKNKDKYAVIQRIGCKYVNGRNIPVNGPTIRHIIDGKYVPIEYNNVSTSRTDLKDWADIILCDNCFRDILHSLTEIYSYSDALKIYTMAILRVC